MTAMPSQRHPGGPPTAAPPGPPTGPECPVRARERCVFVVASAGAAPGLQWIAPFAAFTIAEYCRDHGQHALVVVDDLTKHAATHRELALLTREPPGREAYPGDIFYLHSRLLERSA